MKKLKAAKLINTGLISITGVLVKRYKRCLDLFGFEVTKLSSFSIDGIGWSPEIAEELDNIYYLNNGQANPQAIIISPEQKQKPIYFPFHSFDKDIMNYIFETYQQAISDITRDSAICIDLDQYIDIFNEPFDLLKYQEISIGFRLLDNLNEKQKQQQELIDNFRKDNNFIDESLHLQILASAKKYGDLRGRQLNMQALKYKTDSFYTKAFGGVFILRDSIKPIMIFESEKWHKEAIKNTNYDVLIYHIHDGRLFNQLRNYIVIEYNIDDVFETDRYERIKKHIFVENLPKTKHGIKDVLNDHILFKGYLNKVHENIRDAVLSVEKYVEMKKKNSRLKPESVINPEFLKALHKPHSSFLDNEKELIWKLLCKAAPRDPLHLFWYEKELFYKQYMNWDESYKDWVIEYILEKNEKYR